MPRLLGPKKNGSWTQFFQKTNMMASMAGGLLTGAVAVAAVSTGGVAAAGLGVAAGVVLAAKGRQYEHEGGISGGMAGVQKMAAVQATTAILSVPAELEAEGQNYVGVGTYVFFSQGGVFSSAVGAAAHDNLDIVCRPPSSGPCSFFNSVCCVRVREKVCVCVCLTVSTHTAMKAMHPPPHHFFPPLCLIRTPASPASLASPPTRSRRPSGVQQR